MSDDLSTALGRNINLFEMLQTLRTELGASIEAAKNQQLRFQLNEIELELQVHVSQETERDGKVNFWVLGAGAKKSQSQQDVHVFKLKLKPIPAGNEDNNQRILVSDTSTEAVNQ